MNTFDVSHLSFDSDEPQMLTDPSVPALPSPEEQDDYAPVPGGEGMHQDHTISNSDTDQSHDNNQVTEEDIGVTEDNIQPAPELRRSDRIRAPVDRFNPSANFSFWNDPSAFTDEYEPFPYAFAAGSVARLINEPHNYKAAMKSPDRDMWTASCDKEMENMKSREVWRLVPRPDNQPVVGSKWHLKIKMNPDGSINKHKSWILAKGYTQP